MKSRRTRILAISSGGGHWVQLLRLRPAFEGAHVVYATVHPGYRSDVGNSEFRVVGDGNLSEKMGLIRSACSILFLLLRERPHVVISTGAAPGYFAIRFGKMLGMRTIWVDSIANAEILSLSGRKAGSCSDLWLTQWAHLEREGGPKYIGSVL